MDRKVFATVNTIAIAVLALMGIGACVSGLFSLVGFVVYVIACAIWCACNAKIFQMAGVIQVIETRAIRGVGKSEEDPVRSVLQYWDFDGTLLAEKDPCAEEADDK